MKKRIWSIAVALAMVLSMICSVFVVSAADEVVQITLSSNSVSEGDTLEATVQMNNYASDWKDLAIRLEYDPSMLELVSVDTSGFGADGSYAEEQKGILEAKWSYEEAVVKEESSFDALKISFKVLNGEGASSLKAALQAGELTAEAEAEFRFKKKMAISQQATLLNAGEGLPTLKLSTEKTSLAQGEECIVKLSLENYAGNWATFTAEVTYNPDEFEYKDYLRSEETLGFLIDEEEEGKLTITWLSQNGENILANGGTIELINLKFIANVVPADITATFEDKSVAGYDDGGTPTLFEAEKDYAASTTLSLQLDTNQKRPYLTMRLEDTQGNPISATNPLTPGRQVTAIITLKDFESSWYMMSLSVDFDNSTLAYDKAEQLAFTNIASMLDAEVEGEETTNTVNVSFISYELDNDLQIDGAEPTDIAKLTFTVSGTATETDTASLSTSFKSDGIFTYDAVNDAEQAVADSYYIPSHEDGKATDVPIGEALPPSLSIALKNGAKKKTYARGDTFTAYVRVHDFYQKWSAMSFLLEYNSDVFEIKTNGVSALEFGKEKDGNGAYKDPRVFPVISKLDNETVLSATVFSALGGDVGLVDENNNEITTGEGVVLSVRVRVKTGWETPLDKNGSPITEFPITASFAPEGNLSGDQILTNDNYNETPNDCIVKIADNPSPVITRVVGEGENLDEPIKPGDTVQFAVSVENFAGSWEAMTLAAEFDSEVFELVQDPGTDSNPNSGSSLVTDSKPFKENPDDNNTSNFYPNVLDGYLLASWLNTTDLEMTNKSSQQVMTFTLKAKETVDLTDGDVEATIYVSFVDEGNIAHGKELNEYDYDASEKSITITISNDEVLVNIEWGNMTFTYVYGTWNPETLVWDNRGWSCSDGANVITVTNQGTVAVNAGFTFETEYGNVLEGAFYDGTVKVTAPVALPVGSAAKAITFNLTGGAPENKPPVLGSITVSIT